jgi:hypothetical protein
VCLFFKPALLSATLSLSFFLRASSASSPCPECRDPLTESSVSFFLRIAKLIFSLLALPVGWR